jgi:hypothetical protein
MYVARRNFYQNSFTHVFSSRARLGPLFGSNAFQSMPLKQPALFKQILISRYL